MFDSNGRASTALAHRNDPATSHDAAAGLNQSAKERLFEAIIEILTERPRAAWQVQEVYSNLRDQRGWPNVQPHSVNRRMSELHVAGRIEPEHILGVPHRIPSPAGATATVWQVSS